MTDIVRHGDSIEGLSVEGCARDPLIDRGLYRYHDKDCYRFTASFNIKSKILSELTQHISRIEENAYCGLDAELICDAAVIHSLGDRFTSRISTNVTATHGGNTWHFPRQTNVKIDRAHQEILNAIRKREEKSKIGMSKK